MITVADIFVLSILALFVLAVTWYCIRPICWLFLIIFRPCSTCQGLRYYEQGNTEMRCPRCGGRGYRQFGGRQ